MGWEIKIQLSYVSDSPESVLRQNSLLWNDLEVSIVDKDFWVSLELCERVTQESLLQLCFQRLLASLHPDPEGGKELCLSSSRSGHLL